MSAILRYLCYGITALCVLATVIGVAAGDAPTVKAGFLGALMFGTLSALLHVKRVF